MEVQGTAERDPFSPDQFTELMRLARLGAASLFEAQRLALAGAA